MKKEVLNLIKDTVRDGVRHIARWVHRVTGGKVTPNAITVFGLLMHIPIAIFIARGRLVLAGILLIIFGLFDVLDGELARLQKKSTVRGMLLGATTDRMKETMLYSGAAFYLASGTQPAVAVWAVIACGASLTVSYVKAKGEAAVASSRSIVPHAALNRMFADGLLSFEMRMFVLALGLLTGQLLLAVAGIAVLASLTALQRLLTISEKLG